MNIASLKKKEKKKYPTPIRKSLTGCNFTKLARRGHCWERGVHCHAFFVPSSLFTRAVSATDALRGKNNVKGGTLAFRMNAAVFALRISLDRIMFLGKTLIYADVRTR